MSDHSVVGKTGRVTGKIAPGMLGEVVLPVRGGSEAFYAYAADRGEVIDPGTPIVVIDFEEPRTVRVMPV